VYITAKKTKKNCDDVIVRLVKPLPYLKQHNNH